MIFTKYSKYKSKSQTLPRLKNKAQILFAEYIRLRDLDGQDYFKCISCGQIKPKDQLNAGHYYSVGQYDGLRYDDDNCHGQCLYCNKYLRGNLIEYTRNLPLKIGQKRFEDLQIRAGYYKRNGHKWHRSDILCLIDHFNLLVKALKK